MKKRLLDLFDAVAFYIIYLFSGLLGQILVLLFDVVRTAVDFRGSHMLVRSEIFSEHVWELFGNQVIITILVSNLVVVLLYWLAFCRRQETLRTYAGFFSTRFLGIFGAIISGVILHYLVIGLIGTLELPQEMVQRYDSGMEEFLEGSLWLILVTMLIAAPVVEEIVFRGALLRALQKGLNTPLAFLVSSALFAVAHGDLIQMGYAFVLGLVLCLVRFKSGSLWNAVCMHIAFNAANYLPSTEEWLGEPTFMVVLFAAFLLTCSLACVGNKKHHRYG